MLSALLALALVQQHDLPVQDAMKQIDFMKGSWSGKQEFNTGGAPMVGEATDKVSEAIGGRYLEERLSTTLPGRAPTDTRHYISYDPDAKAFKAWWFNDTAVGPTEFEGKVEDGRLVLLSKPKGQGPQNARLRATYWTVTSFKPSDFSSGTAMLSFKLEMDAGGEWMELFTTTYTKKQD